MSSVEVLSGPLSNLHGISFTKAAADSAPPTKRRRTDLMDIKELAEFLREETNLLTELPTHVRDSITVTPDAIALFAYYVRQLIGRDYTMTQNDYFINRLPVYLPAVAQVRSLPDGGPLHAHDLIYRVAMYHFHKLAFLRSHWAPTPASIQAFQAIDEVMLSISVDLWEKAPEHWTSPAMRNLIGRIRDTQHDQANPDMARKYLHRTAQFLAEMRAATTARMLARKLGEDRLPAELVGELERQILASRRLPYLPTAGAVRRLWVPRPGLPLCSVHWTKCSKTCPNIMEIDWVGKERRFVYYHQGRQRCHLEHCRGHHEFFPDDPYDTNFLLYRTNGGVGFFD
ncbi:MAG: hypothetical protein Q9157_007701 [Trypethelium eluteriae]